MPMDDESVICHGRDQHIEQSHAVFGWSMTAHEHRWMRLGNSWGNPMVSCASGVFLSWRVDMGSYDQPCVGWTPCSEAFRPVCGRLVTMTECDRRLPLRAPVRTLCCARCAEAIGRSVAGRLSLPVSALADRSIGVWGAAPVCGGPMWPLRSLSARWQR